MPEILKITYENARGGSWEIREPFVDDERAYRMDAPSSFPCGSASLTLSPTGRYAFDSGYCGSRDYAGSVFMRSAT